MTQLFGHTRFLLKTCFFEAYVQFSSHVLPASHRLSAAKARAFVMAG